jgi:hypothetical protein
MNSHRAVQLDTGRWAVTWCSDETSQCFTLGTCTDEAEACLMAYEVARMEMKEAIGKSGSVE